MINSKLGFISYPLASLPFTVQCPGPNHHLLLVSPILWKLILSSYNVLGIL